MTVRLLALLLIANHYIYYPMKWAAANAPLSFTRTLLVVGVLVSLCFSDGEGLRLRPIPGSALQEAAALTSHSQFPLLTSSLPTPSQYASGPVMRPVAAHKLAKRQPMGGALLPSRITAGWLTLSFWPLGDGEPLSYQAPRHGSHQADRAPPRTT